MKIRCGACGKELKKPGGLLFGPIGNELWKKTHLCLKCLDKIDDFIIQLITTRRKK